MRDDVRWTNLTPTQIARQLSEPAAEAGAEAGAKVGRRVVKQLLTRHRYRRRKAMKDQTMGRRHPDRDAQFRNIARLRAEYLAAGDPVLSVDTKKKELLGNFFRTGTLYTREAQHAFDHDFPSFASGVAIPHGLYDVGRNRGHINLGTSRDTSEFACDSIGHWWRAHGRAQYPRARRLLLLCDGGGSNSASHYLFKQDLQRLADELALEVRVAHYPPYCSKYNPVEHRMFPHVTAACRGVIFHTVGVVKHFMERTTTSTGLKVTVDVLDKVYATGRRCAAGFRKTMRIVFDELMPKWNYRAVPNTA